MTDERREGPAQAGPTPAGKWKWGIITTAADGTQGIYGPFYSEAAALKAQRVIETCTDLETQVTLMEKYRRADFSIYS